MESQGKLDANQCPIIKGRSGSRSTGRGFSSIGNKKTLVMEKKTYFLMYMTLSH